jgi:colanic acid/amylovoran biosynthesis protein
MKIIIENSGYGLDNLGDVAMLQAAAMRIHTIFPSAHLSIVTTSPERLNKYIPYASPLRLETRDSWLCSFNLIGGWQHFFPRKSEEWLMTKERTLKTRHPAIARRRLLMRFGSKSTDYLRACDFVDQIQNADLVIGTGGGYINDTFKVHAQTVLNVLMLAQTFRVPTALLGQGLGPISDRNLIHSISQAFNKLDLLSLREGLFSPAIAVDIGKMDSKKMYVTGDDAIELAYCEPSNTNASSIGVNIRIANYSGLSQDQSYDIGDIIRAFAESNSAGFEVLPIDISDNGSDKLATERMLGMSSDAIEPHDNVDSTASVISSINRCKIIITGSYHAAVFALSRGVPVVAIVASEYYSTKFEGLRHQFGSGISIIYLSTPAWKANLIDSLDFAWNSSSSVKSELLISAKGQLDTGRQAYSRLGEMFC